MPELKKAAGQAENNLAGILSRFDTEDKGCLGEELISALGLDPGRGFVRQVQKRLGRHLTDFERFQVDALYRAFKADEEEAE